jgi:hypothetical protein
MTPSTDLASTGYCLANPEREFLVFLPEGDFVTVDLSKVLGSLRAEWMHPVEGTIIPGGSVAGGKPRDLTRRSSVPQSSIFVARAHEFARFPYQHNQAVVFQDWLSRFVISTRPNSIAS